MMLFGGRPKLSIGMITGIPASIDNKYVPGSGVGATSISVRRAKSIHSTPKVRGILPNAPTSVTALYRNGFMIVSWTPPEYTGNSIVYMYQVTMSSASSGFTRETYGPSMTFSSQDLTDGTAYTFRVVAVNTTGNSTSSSPSTPVTYYIVPDAPTSLVVVSYGIDSTDNLLGIATIAFTPPANAPSTTITNYQYSLDSEEDASFVAISPATTTSPIRIGGLTMATTYQLRIRAINVHGVGPISSSIELNPYSAPSAPVIDTAQVDGMGSITIYFSPPVNDGGSPITDYEYAIDNNAFVSGQTDVSPMVISGLTVGQSYYITIRAVNDYSTTNLPGASSVPIHPII
jgi:hypothetical protein